MSKIESPVCTSCGRSKKDCKCKKNKNEFSAVIGCYYYKDRVVKAINECKNNEMPFLCERFAKDIAKCVEERYSDIAFDLVSFVPMRKDEERKRGYNQAKLIANGVSEILNLPCDNLLLKVEKIKPQKTRSTKERQLNVFGAFDVSNKGLVEDKIILLIDDVKTSGATLNECSKMLRIYGAKAVYCAVLALAGRRDENDNYV